MDLHGRRFVAGPDDVPTESLRGRESFGALQIRLHEWLAVTKVEGSACAFVLLGHAIDPAQPANDNHAVLRALSYWESRLGNWSSLCCTALDGFCEVISPYNSRRLIEAGLGVDVVHRCKPYELHRRLSRPELRSIPFNETRLERWYAHVSGWLPWRAQQLIKRWTHLGS